MNNKVNNGEILENRPPELVSPVFFDSYRTESCKDSITLEFGKSEKSGDKEAITVVASIKCNPNMLTDLILRLFSVGLEYQEKYGIKIGFPEQPKEEKK